MNELDSADSVKLLLEKGADPNVQNNDGYTILMWAALSESCNAEVVKMLLAGGANVNAKAKNGTTAMTYAKRRGETAIVSLLKEAGAVE